MLELITATLASRKPRVPRASQCTECKAHGTVCLMVTEGAPCLGPVTQAGCGNLCPSHGRPCYGCFGPFPFANVEALSERFEDGGATRPEIRDLYRSFNAGAEAFAKESVRHD